MGCSYSRLAGSRILDEGAVGKLPAHSEICLRSPSPWQFYSLLGPKAVVLKPGRAPTW